MIKNILSVALFFLLTVVANAQVVKCTYKSTYHETDSYTCEDGYSRSYTRANLLKEPHPHEVMYSCWTYTRGKEGLLYINKPSTMCAEALSKAKIGYTAYEKNYVREKVSGYLFRYLQGIIAYYAEKDSLNLSWKKTGDELVTYVGGGYPLHYNFQIEHDDTYQRGVWYWKDKKHHDFLILPKEPTKGHGITFEIKGDMPYTGCKSGTTLTFLIDDDYRLIFPSTINKYSCFDSVATNGFRDVTFEYYLEKYKSGPIKNGDTSLKDIIKKIDSQKKENARHAAEEARFEKAWNEAKADSLNDLIEYSIKMCVDSRSSCQPLSDENFFYFNDERSFASDDFDMGTIDLGDIKNKRLEFTIVMNWEELNKWNDKNYWDEKKWGSKDIYGKCKEEIGEINIEVGFMSRENVAAPLKTVARPINNYLVVNENSHPWVKKVSIPLEDFTSEINEKFNWSRVEKVFINVVYSGSDCDSGFRLKLFGILGKNFYDIINVAIVNLAPAEKILDIDPTTCSSENKGSFKNGLVNVNNTYICSDSGWSLYSVKIGNVEITARNLDVGGKTFIYDNMYFEEENQIKAWDRYSQNWGHIYEKSDLHNVCPDGWRLPNESDLNEIKNQIDSKYAVFPYINYSYETSADEYGCVDMYGNRVRKDTSLCEIATFATRFDNNTYIIPDDGKRRKYSYVHPNVYWGMGKNGEVFVYGVDNFKKRDKDRIYVDDVNFIRCVKSDNNLGKVQTPVKKNTQRKASLKEQKQEQVDAGDDQKQESANAAVESAMQDDEESSINVTKLLRIGVFSAVAIGGGVLAYVFDKRAKDATAIPPTNEEEFQKGHDDAKKNQNARNVSLGVAAAGLVALGISILF